LGTVTNCDREASIALSRGIDDRNGDRGLGWAAATAGRMMAVRAAHTTLRAGSL
jgi:hypothetical protein